MRFFIMEIMTRASEWYNGLHQNTEAPALPDPERRAPLLPPAYPADEVLAADGSGCAQTIRVLERVLQSVAYEWETWKNSEKAMSDPNAQLLAGGLRKLYYWLTELPASRMRNRLQNKMLGIKRAVADLSDVSMDPGIRLHRLNWPFGALFESEVESA